MELLGFQIVRFAMESTLKFEKPLRLEEAWDIGLFPAENDRNTYEGGPLFDVEWILAEVWLSDGKADEEEG